MWTLAIVTVLALAGAAWYIVSDLLAVAESANEELKTDAVAQPAQEELESENTIEAKEELPEEEVYENPFGESKAHRHLRDGDYQNYIHQMAHQKVIADVKWGFIEITEERIDWLLKGLQETELEHEDVYRDILERWATDNFGQVDQDHNTIWRLQGGTIGEATGILSPEEEEAYIKSAR